MKVIIDGDEIELGTTEAQPTIGIVDYSRRETDDFGVTTVVRRGFARRMSVRAKVTFDEVDALQRTLADLRARAVKWVADERFASLAFDGFYKDFAIDLAVPPVSFCTLTVEGLTETEAGADPGGDPATDGNSSTLRLLQPATIDDSVLTASSIAEDDQPAWTIGTTYPFGARVIHANRQWESVVVGNLGHEPAADSTQWMDIGPTNRWAMFDEALGTLTEAAGSIVVTLDPAQPVDSLALLDVTAATVRVQAPGYDRTIVPAGVSGAAMFLDLPATAAAITITVSGAGSVSVGTLLMGSLVGLGVTGASPSAGINDFSRKETDEFGDAAVVERAWAKRMEARALLRTDAVDLVFDRIATVRGRPCLWIGAEGVEALSIYGFFKDFSVEVGENVSTLSLSIEGLSKAQPLAPLTDPILVTVYQSAPVAPPTPAPNSGEVPLGWSVVPTDISAGVYRWSTQAQFLAGEQKTDWTVPVRVAGTAWEDVADPIGSKPADNADVTQDVIENARFDLAAVSGRMGTEVRPRFDPIFWTCNFPNTMMAAVTGGPASIKMDAVFFERGHLAGLIWESADKLDHATTRYDTDKDYRNCTLAFDYALIGDIRPIDEIGGPTLTIEGRDASGSAMTAYVMLYHCRTGGDGVSGHCVLDFNNLPAGYDGSDDVFAGDVDRMFISMSPGNYLDGSTTKLSPPIEGAMILSNITVTGSNSALVCGLGPGGEHRVRMTNGYDDTYNIVPDRIVRNCRLLGYEGEFNHYVGMSHYFQWAWDAGASRYIAQDATNPLNTPCRVWHEALAAALGDAGMSLIVSLSYELLNSFCPTSWRQLDSVGNPALTGWSPPSALLSPCNTTAMGYLQKVARQFCGIAADAGLDIHFQVGEPWYWINFAGVRTPFFYDPDTTALYTTETGLTAPIITDMSAAISSAQLVYLDWLGEKLAASILDLIDAVRGDHPAMTSYALLYLPQMLGESTPEAHRVNMPPALAYPALDILQVEDYDFVIDNRPDLSATGRDRIEKTLGYPRSKQHYFAGFALNADPSGALWRRITNAMAAAYEWGVDPVFVWAYTQVMRDSYVPLFRAAPALGMADIKDVDLSAGTVGRDVLVFDHETRRWVPGKPWLADIPTLPGVPTVQLPTLTSPWINYGGGYVGARYYKTAEGLVVIEGLIQAPGGSPSVDVVLFTLLEGYRPSGTLMFGPWSGGGSCRIDVTDSGEVVMRNGNTAFTSLAGITFIAA
ncbi:hypothetical protein [Sphingobium sp. CFD-2]|uniref:non-contractile tail sheath protein n=1 Tax=Sphingobium sp. CFD-2 TaxID=2878542 RepID=UPI00214B11F2|nr:hypothetical protein [Sphingobium sp. CFD-2]